MGLYVLSAILLLVQEVIAAIFALLISTSRTLLYFSLLLKVFITSFALLWLNLKVLHIIDISLAFNGATSKISC
jgi:hypothetical protein